MGIVKKEDKIKNELVATENNAPQHIDADILNTDVSFDDKVEIATKVAGSLQQIIEKCEMYAEIPKGSGNKYVTVEGWSTLGTCLGVYAYVEEVVPIQSKKRVAYKATVSIRNNTGQIFSRASAISTSGEGKRTDDFAIYSMAQTRATGKAFRLALSWIMNLAGYKPTLAEEMSEIERKEKFNNAKSKLTKKNDDAIEAEVVNENNKGE